MRLSLLLLLLCSAPLCKAQEPVELELVLWADNLSAACDVTHCGDDRLFVARQWGLITIVQDSMVNLSPAFLDISGRTLYNGERGLLGIVFDPDYATNGYFYVSYVTGTGNGTTRISRFSRSTGDPNLADATSEVVLISLPQPGSIHKGGGLVFGTDGYLYCSIGDGGDAGDPNGYG
ncbi:MAG TPA: PQQ-dependent sugar dehydrogenase, partial [Flavobacteriales bacterium]|nr:PQQ-dependent sugar dehydrogenase [Flavobacteriales bacterium]